MADLLDAARDMPSFKVVSPRQDLRIEDFALSDGTKLVGPGGLLIPPARSFATIVNSGTRVFSSRFDEAMRDNFTKARAMRRDAFLLGLHEERVLPTINRRWHLKVPDDQDKAQSHVRESLTSILESLPQFPQFKRALTDGVWFGRAGTQWGYQRDRDNEYRWGIPKWDPLHGDSIQYTFDGVPAVLLDSTTTGWYSQHGATWGPTGDIRSTDRGGMALVLHRPYWRARFAVYQHIRQKADYFEGELAGSVQGLGIRGQVYWHYVIRTEALSWMLTYMQSVGQMDLLIFNYPAGNAEAKRNQEENAAKISGKVAIACPRNPQQNWPAIEQLKMNAEGLEALHRLLSEYFDRHIERLYVGQSMSSGADNESGLGGTGRANFSMMTKDEILSYDTSVLDETITRDVLGPLKAYNFPWARFPVRFESIMPDLEANDKLQNGISLVGIGVPLKMDELREQGGYSRPEEGDETVGGADPMMGGLGGMGMPLIGPAGPGGTPPPPGPPVGPAAGQPPVAGPLPPTAPPGAEPPTPFDAAGGAPAAGPAMGSPGGGNTYLPGFRRPPEETVGFTRRTDFSDLPRAWSAGGGRWMYTLTEDQLHGIAGGQTQYTRYDDPSRPPSISPPPPPSEPPVSQPAPHPTQPVQRKTPDPRQLERANVVKALHPGVGLVRDDAGTHWVVKGRANKPHHAANESLVSSHGHRFGAETIPVHHVKLHGQDHAVSEFIPGVKDLTTFPKGPERDAAFTRIPHEHKDRHALFDYVVGSSDPNLGNYVQKPDGGLIALDKEQSLGVGHFRDRTVFRPPEFMFGDHEFDRGRVHHAAGAADQMAADLEARGMRREAAGVRRRGQVLRQLGHGQNRPTAAELDRLGQEHERANRQGWLSGLRARLGV